MIINYVSDVQTTNTSSDREGIKMLDELALEADKPAYNFGFEMMYSEWRQKILMSDGVNDEENFDW